MLLYGASGHGKVVASILEKEVTAFFDDNETLKTFCSKKVTVYSKTFYPDEKIVITVGANAIRNKISKQITHVFGLVIHPSAEVHHSVSIGEGSQIIHGSVIQADTKVGRHCIINTRASIDHDCKIEDFCHIAPGATLCGDVLVGEGSFVGAGSTIIQGVKIGKWCTIGAGSVVINDIPNGATAVGNPAKIIKINE